MCTRWAAWMGVGLMLAVSVGCGGEDEGASQQRGLSFGNGSKSKSQDKKGTAAPTTDENSPKAPLAPLNYSDEDFVELETINRDPFRSFARTFKVQSAAPAQRRVLMSETSLDEMKLIAVITNLSQPRAMLVDSSKVGHVVKAGDYVGRPEVVRTGGAEGMPVTLNWRVDRVRPGSLVLTREDPTAPDRPPLTRVMALHDAQRSR